MGTQVPHCPHLEPPRTEASSRGQVDLNTHGTLKISLLLSAFLLYVLFLETFALFLEKIPHFCLLFPGLEQYPWEPCD